MALLVALIARHVADFELLIEISDYFTDVSSPVHQNSKGQSFSDARMPLPQCPEYL